MRKCKHKKEATKFIHTKKYGEPILVEYTYCEDCKCILSGNVSFVKQTEFPIRVEQEIVQKVENPKVKKAKVKKTLVKKIKKPSKKTRPIKLKKATSDIREASRRPSAPSVPEGTTLSDILRAKYNLTRNKETSKKVKQPIKKIRSSKKLVDPDTLDSSDDDPIVFMKG